MAAQFYDEKRFANYREIVNHSAETFGEKAAFQIKQKGKDGYRYLSYEEARDYLLNKLKEDNKKASYEIREENKELISYNSNDSGAQGYQFSVYETDKNEKIGIYYVDKENGKIYRYMGKQSIEAY